MKKLSIKDVVAFRKKSDRGKKNFATAIRLDKEKIQIDEGGGDYWISCLSAISSSYKLGDAHPITKRREELERKIETAEYDTTKKMYKRNIKILYNYENFNIVSLRPSINLIFLKQKKDNYTLIIKELPVQVAPQYVFTFHNSGLEEVGAIWFIAKLGGFEKDELGMFTDILYRYLGTHFSEGRTINSKYCIAVDVFNNFDVSYLQIEDKEVSKILDSTLDAIKALM